MPSENASTVNSLNIDIEASAKKLKKAIQDALVALKSLGGDASNATKEINKTAESTKKATESIEATTAAIGKLNRAAEGMGYTNVAKLGKAFQKVFSKEMDFDKYSEGVTEITNALDGLGREDLADAVSSIFANPEELERSLQAQKAAAEESARAAKEARAKELEDLRHTNRLKEQEQRDSLIRQREAERRAAREAERQRKDWYSDKYSVTGSAEEIGKLARELDHLGYNNVSDTLRNIQLEVEKDESYERLTQRVNDLAAAFERAGNVDIANAIRANSDFVGKEAEALQAKEHLKETAEATKRLSSANTKSSVSARNNSKALQKLGNVAKSLGKHFKSAAASVKDFFGGLTANLGSGRSGGASKHVSGLSKLLKSIGRIGFYRAIRTVMKKISQAIQEGMDNLYQYSTLMGTAFAKSRDSIATSALYMKNAIATVAEPIINLIAPAIDLLSDKFAELASMVAEFLAALTGKSVYTKAIKYVTKYKEEAEGTAKALQKWLAPFDEINRMSDDTHGIGGSGLDFEKMFEEAFVDSDVSELVKRIKEAFESGDFTSIGATLSRKLKESLQAIDWEGIQKKADKIAKSIATFINGAVSDPKLAEEIGKAINKLLTVGFDTATTFAETLDWAAIGKFIGTTITSGLKNFNFKSATKAVKAIIKGLTTLLTSTVESISTSDVRKFGLGVSQFISDSLDSIDWSTLQTDAEGIATRLVALLNGFFENPQLGTSIGHTLSGMLNTAVTFVSTVTGTLDWQKIGSAVGEALKTLLTDFNFEALGTAFGDFANGILDACLEAVGKLSATDWEKLGTKIAEAVNRIRFGELFQKAVNLAATIFTGVLTALVSFTGKMNEDGTWNEIGTKIGETLRDIDWIGVLGAVADLGKNVITGVWEAIKSAAAAGLGIDKEGADGIMDAIGVGLLVAKLANLLGLTRDITGAFGGKNDALKKQTERTNTETSAVGSLAFTFGIASVAVGLLSSLLGGLSGKLGDVDGKIDPLIDNKVPDLSGDFNFLSYIVGITSTSIGLITTLLGYLKDKLEGAKQPTSDLGDLLTDTTGAFDHMYQVMDAKLPGVVRSYNLYGGQVKQSLKTNIEDPLNSLAGTTKTKTGEIIGYCAGGVAAVGGFGATLARILGGSGMGGFRMTELKTQMFYANGGYPTAGSLFVAGERPGQGPEFVGSFSGQTGVWNSDQLVQGMYNAFTAALSNMPSGGDIYLDGQVIYRNVVRRNNNYVRSTGRTALLT